MSTTKTLICCWALLLVLSCREKYVLPFTSPKTGYLVVEGTINSGQGPTKIILSRTVGLEDSITLKKELKAQVSVQGEDNSIHILTEAGNGVYNASQLTLNTNVKYRLHIVTAGGKEYASDFITAKKTPPIDSISWERINDVELFVNTHDPLNNTIYYKWEYEETWEFHSRYYTSVKYFPIGGNRFIADYRLPSGFVDFSVYACWKDEFSTRILIGSSAALSRDTIHLPILSIPAASQKISVLYSVNVKQFAISSEEYEFLRRMKKNTEQVGSLFDAQPSELTGNIKCITNPGEPVIGFIGIAELQQKRLFIRNSEVPGWNYRMYCEQQEMVIGNSSEAIKEFIYLEPTTTHEYNDQGEIVSFKAASPYCVICTLTGTNVKPSFWP